MSLEPLGNDLYLLFQSLLRRWPEGATSPWVSVRVRARAHARLGLAYRTVWGQPTSQPVQQVFLVGPYVFTISAAWVAFTLLLAAIIAAHWQRLAAG